MTRSLRSFLIPLVVVSPLALTACGPTSDLAGLPDKELLIDVHQDGDGYSVSLDLRHSASDVDDCPSLRTDAIAELDGVNLPMLHEGGTYRAFDGNRVCRMPGWYLSTGTPIAGRERSLLRIEDASLTAEVEVEGLLVPRSFSLRGSGVLEPGQEAVAEWSVSTDTLSFEENGSSVFVSFVPDQGELHENGFVMATMELTRDQVSLEGTTVRFTVPSDTPAGEGTLVVHQLAAQPRLVRTSGIEKVWFGFLPIHRGVRTRVNTR